jgi:hypothetical protein
MEMKIKITVELTVVQELRNDDIKLRWAERQLSRKIAEMVKELGIGEAMTIAVEEKQSFIEGEVKL